MIFKNWFKPKWQHPDSSMRQQAIASLSAGQREHKQILHELAFNDSNETVRQSALAHLNDFSLWWQASKQDSSDRLRQFAEQQLLAMLLQQQIAAPQKRQFIAQCNRVALLEQLAERETDAEILFSVLERLNKPELNSKALTGTVLTIAQKQQLLAQVDDQKQLEKLSKLLTGELAEQLQLRMSEQAELKQKPVKLRKDLTLLLARLNALRDRFSVAEIPAQLAELQTQWQQLKTELDCLPQAEAAGIEDKYQQLLTKLEAWLAPQLQQLAIAQAEAEQKAAAAAQYQQLSAALTELTQQLTEALAQVDISAAETIAEQLSLLSEQILAADVLSVSQRNELQTQQRALSGELNRLPQTAEKLSQASRLVSDWAAQALPVEPAQLDKAKQQLNQYKANWHNLMADLSLAVPDSLADAKQQLQQQWQQAIKAISNQSERALRQCRSKIAEFKRLDQQGRYKVLFGLFKGINAEYAMLNEAEQQKLAADYEFARKRIAELADWQEYIATPRKQELLAQLQQLASNEPADIPARAEQIKQARQQWSSFGKAGVEQEAELNAAFDLACEQAYAPCRVYFAEQDALKAANFKTRQAIIEQLEQLLAAPTEPSALDGTLKSLTQAWQQAGPVKRQDYLLLQQRYQAAMSPLKAQLTELQQQVAGQKQALISEAQAATALSDSNQSSKILKELQQRWKQLGFAGKKHDQQLWQQFRQICDGFFSQRQAIYAQQQQQQLEQEQALTTALAEIAQRLQALTVTSASDEFSAVAAQLQQLDVGVMATARKQRDQLQQQLTDLMQQQSTQAAQQDINSLFEQLAQPGSNSDSWPAQFTPQPDLAGALGLDRKGLTLALEIMSDINGPEQERSERQQVQLTLLTLKHNAGEVADKQSLLKHWLAFGPLSDAELVLLPRLKAVFSAR
ncbi:DUF349 domain-containing protein [Arsukibacterium sp.]|uniref:DUF349 domain-containing protein n=1 Tax=Arsukibacterium sp. TaxID=1977258 RepID=UPI00299F315A|nr:DUF349 domain-containing protein [Arsukibacterium sp.]MDX1676637.1 DUF349 domain-containing protein [Arsukibacterium sp.]